MVHRRLLAASTLRRRLVGHGAPRRRHARSPVAGWRGVRKHACTCRSGAALACAASQPTASLERRMYRRMLLILGCVCAFCRFSAPVKSCPRDVACGVEQTMVRAAHVAVKGHGSHWRTQHTALLAHHDARRLAVAAPLHARERHAQSQRGGTCKARALAQDHVYE